MHRESCNATDGPLHGRWPLRRGVNFQAIVLGRNGIRSLRLDVEMLLSVHVGASFEDVITSFESSVAVAEFESFRRDDEITVSGCYARIEYGLERFDVG